MNLVESSNITKYSGTSAPGNFVLREMDLKVRAGDFVSILGSQGSGKSTLLHIISMMDEPQGGEYNFYGQDTGRVSWERLRASRSGNLAYISQEDTLDDSLTVYENLEKPLIAKSIPASSRRSRIKRMLERFHIDVYQSLYPGQLTPVVRRLVTIATALVKNPKLIIADEPTGGLDPMLGKGIMELLKRLNRKGVTIIQTTRSSTEAAYGNRVIRLKHQVN